MVRKQILSILLAVIFFTAINVVSASLPTAKQFITSSGTLQESFDDTANWALSGVGAVKTADTVIFLEGTQSINVTSVNGVGAYITKTISKSFSSASNFPFWVYITNKTTISNIAVYISSSATFVTYYIISITGVGCINGWNHLDIPKQNFTTTTGESWSNTMVRIRFRVNPQSTDTAMANFDWFTTDIQARAKCIISFDDGWGSTYDKAYSIMNPLGLRGTSFVILNTVGTTNYMTTAQLTAMYSSGWDISDHSVTHVDLTSVSQATLDYETYACYNWLLQQGFTKSAYYFAYPYGGYNDTVIASVARYHVASRTVHNGAWQPHMTFPSLSNTQYLLKNLIVTNITTTTEVQAYIDGTIQENGLLILTFHRIVDAGANYDTYYLTSDFTTIMNYLASKTANIDVATMSDLFDLPPPTSMTSVMAVFMPIFGLGLAVSLTFLFIGIGIYIGAKNTPSVDPTLFVVVPLFATVSLGIAMLTLRLFNL